MSMGKILGSSGYSLVELLVSITIALILTGAMVVVYLGQKASYLSQEDFARTQENGRYAFSLLVNDIYMAGYWGGYSGPSKDIANGTIETTNCNQSTWALVATLRLYGLDDTIGDDTTAGNFKSCISSASNPIEDILVIRRAAGTPVAASGLSNNLYYLKTDYDAAAFFTGTAVPTNVALGSPQYIYPVLGRAYYVRNGSISCTERNGPPLPSLFRYTVRGNGVSTEEELVGPVEKFQIQYGVDTNGDMTVDAFYSASELNLSSSPSWKQVIAVRFYLLLRAACPENGFTDELTYTLPDGNYTPKDSYRRQLYTTTVYPRNPAL
jgi:type II secretory pathway pseudopilin PulG